jgi:hypothetical protein
MASAAESYVKGSEYELPDGTLGVWSGKGFVTAEAYLKMKGESQTQFDDKRALMTAIDRAEKKANWFSTGPLGKFQAGDDTDQPKWKGIAGSPGYNLDKALLPIRSNLFMTSLMEMRQNSPTGAGIGNPTNPEGKKIESKDGALDVGMSEADLRYNLGTIREAQIRRTPGLGTANPITLSEDNRSEVPQSAYFRAADGKVYRNQRGAGFPGQIVTVQTPADAAKLKPGTRFRTPDGQIRTRN